MSKINCIVIVDDDPICTFITKGACAQSNVADEIVSFNNSIEALIFIKEYIDRYAKSPQLIIADINMPELNGFEFIKRMNALPMKNRNETVFIGMSASVRADWQQRRSNFKEIISKPFTLEKARHIFEVYFALKAKLEQNPKV